MSWSTSKSGEKATVMSDFADAMGSYKNQDQKHDEVIDAVIGAAVSVVGDIADDRQISVDSHGHVGADGKGNASLTISF